MPGKHYEDLEVGMVLEHTPGRTITEADNTFFTTLTMNNQPLHLDEEFSKGTRFGTRIVNGLLTLSVSVGLSVPDLTAGTIVANLGYYEVEHTTPVFHGDTIRVTSEVTGRRRTSNPEAGLVEVLHRVHNQDGEEVLTYKRRALFEVREPDEGQDAPPEGTFASQGDG